MTHIAFERLSDLADAETIGGAAARDEETRHLSACAECRATLSEVRSLLTAARSLPREVTPPAETWTELRSRVGVARRSRMPGRQWGWGEGGGRWLAAAASIIIVVGAALLIPGGRGKGNVVKATAPAVSQPAVVARVDERYAPTLAELRATLDTHRPSYTPGAARLVDRTLAVIDDAIAETRAALVADPENPELVDILSSQYEHKVELLQRATELAPSS